jgi:hypothetical protein
MTTVILVERTCAVCGRESQQTALGSTSSFGAPDLDLRPAPLERHTLRQQVEACPHCGYCAQNISRVTVRARRAISSTAYKADLERESFPELTRQFLCVARTLAAAGRPVDAGWTALKGAWAADDEENDEAARHCRGLAVSHFLRARRNRRTFFEEIGGEEALLADLHRRVGDFPSATVVGEEGISGGAEGLLRDILLFQIRLASEGDSGCHNLDEIEPEG